MIILSHRGFWVNKEEQNTAASFHRSFGDGFGTETDFRDLNGELVISHDMAKAGVLTAAECFEIYNRYNKGLPLALNIKADGLQAEMKHLIDEFALSNYFVFDMSIPDTLGYIKHGIKFFTRQSEYEREPALYDEAEGIWLDEFKGHWIDKNLIINHLSNNKKVCIVSPDLHKRGYEAEWEHYRSIEREVGMDAFMLCTDYPDKAKTFFN